MAGTICIFEDDRVTDLHPLTLTRPVYELRCGMTSLREKVIREFQPSSVVLHCRGYLAAAVREETGSATVNELPNADILFVNGRLLATPGVARAVEWGAPRAYFAEDELVAA